MSQKEIAIIVNNVHKSFKLPVDSSRSLKSLVVNFYKPESYKKHHVQALRGVDLEIKKGEFFGIVGRNGSGKSTMLKILAQIYMPTKGSVDVRGTLTPFIELGVGFNPELTGRENVYLSGAILGMTEDEVRKKYHKIVEFAELEDFMEQKLKNYSSGMQVRLAFAVAIQAHNDILLVDEVLAVGDAAFQQKCFEYFEQLKAEKKTVVFVSHDIESVLRFCDRAALIQDGKVKVCGTPESVIDTYINPINKKMADRKEAEYEERKKEALSTNEAGAQVKVEYSLNIPNGGDIDPDNRPEVTCKITPRTGTYRLAVELIMKKNFLQKIYWARSDWATGKWHEATPDKPLELTFKIQNIFASGNYSIDAQVIADNEQSLDFHENALEFNIVRKGDNAWLLHPMVEVDVKKKQ